MKHSIKTVFYALCCLFIFIRPAYNQSVKKEKETKGTMKDQPYLLWGSLGGGFLGTMFAGDIKLTYAWDIHSISAKVAGATNLAIFGPAPGEITEYGFYYGPFTSSTFFLGRFAAGFSYFEGSIGESAGNFAVTNSKDIHNFGFGLEAEAMFKYKFIGVSAMFQFVGSSKFHLAGLLINISVGKLE